MVAMTHTARLRIAAAVTAGFLALASTVGLAARHDSAAASAVGNTVQTETDQVDESTSASTSLSSMTTQTS
jgi:hypothetical protein